MMKRRNVMRLLPLAAMGLVVATSLAIGQAQEKRKVGFKDTPMLPGGRWHVHDSDRPLPKVITPGTCSTQEEPGHPPSDAIVLFDGKDLSQWQSGRGRPAGWLGEGGGVGIKTGAGES